MEDVCKIKEQIGKMGFEKQSCELYSAVRGRLYEKVLHQKRSTWAEGVLFIPTDLHVNVK